MTKEIDDETGLVCRESYNGNCILKCKHAMPHKKNDECRVYCHRMKRKAICIEVEFTGWSVDAVTSPCGKKVSSDCQRG